MKTYFLLLLLFCCIDSMGQALPKPENLVRDGGFEDITCVGDPFYTMQLNQWYSPQLEPMNIIPLNPCLGYSYLNSIGQAELYRGVPANFYGYSWPYKGKGYIWLCLHLNPSLDPMIDTTVFWDSRLYIAQKLDAPLDKDSIYCYSMRYKMPDRKGNFRITTNRLGVVFTADSLVDYNYPTGYNELIATPSLELDTNEYLTDTVNWRLFKGYYKAKGGEQYLTIGNFYSKGNTPVKVINPLLPEYVNLGGIAVYIDDVRLYKNECPDEYINPDTVRNPIPRPGTEPEGVLSALYLPTAFTPNNDGRNDVFRVLGSPQVSNFKLCVYNRWGREVYCGNTIYEGWDGNCNGAPCEMATYVWVATYTDVLSGEQRVERGNVILIR